MVISVANWYGYRSIIKMLIFVHTHFTVDGYSYAVVCFYLDKCMWPLYKVGLLNSWMIIPFLHDFDLGLYPEL